MMFRDDQQISAVCERLMHYTHKPELWGRSGPSIEACRLYEVEGGYLSSGEWALLAFCFALWNGGRHAHVSQILNLDTNHRRRVAGILLCATPHDVDNWLEGERHE